MKEFSCRACGHMGPSNDGIEQDDDGRVFVACEDCGARHQVVDDPSASRSGRRFEVIGPYVQLHGTMNPDGDSLPNDQAAMRCS